MALDPTIPLQVKAPEPVNMLTQIGQYAGISNALQQNKLLGIAQQRGEIGIQQDQTQLQQAQQNQATQGSNRIAQQTAALMATPDAQLTPETIKGVIQSEVAAGTVPETVAQVWMKNVDAVGNDPTKLRTMLTAHLVGTIAGPPQVQAIFGTNGEQTNGQTLFSGVNRSPIQGGGFMPSTGTPQVLSPAQKAQMVPTVNAAGQTGSVPLSTRVDDQGNPIGGSMGNGRYPASPQQPGQAPQADNNPPGFTPTGLPPGEVEAKQTAAAGAAKAGNDLSAQADAARTQKSQLDNLAADLARMQATGPGSARMAMANAISQKYGGFGLTMSADELAASENFAKIAKQIAMAQSNTLGVGTDEKLTTALGSNPNLDLSKLGNTQIIAMLKGNSDAIMAKNEAWQKWQQAGNSPSSYNQFQTQFNRTFDPRAYQWNYLAATMTPKQRQDYISALPDKGASLKAAYNRAVADGLLTPYGQ